MTHTTNVEAAILIVDDEVSLRKTFQTFLERAGYETVMTVGSFGEAVQAVSARMFDLIFCDIVLENHSGIELLRRMRELDVYCPVVIITGYPQVETASDAVRLGAFDYLPKPVEKDVLLKTARLAIYQYRLEQEKQAAELARERYRRYLETVFKSVSDCIITIDQNLNILKMNEAAILHFQKQQPYLHEGETLNCTCNNKNLCQLTENIGTVLKTGTEVSDHRMECLMDNSSTIMSVCISPLDSSPGESGGAVLVFRDMTCQTQRHRLERTQFHTMIGASSAMQNVYQMIENIGKFDTSVLFTGASGTGKELAVHALHQESPRRNKPLVMVNCAAISDTLQESELFGHRKGAFTGAEESRQGRILQAEDGTLFLDEIGDISTTMQLRLLRFLQEKTFYPVGSDKEIQIDVRVVAATNADLKEKVRQGTFREDLYYRLLIIDIHLPPLVERTGDITLLTTHFIDQFSHSTNKTITGISAQAMALLQQYSWPGNVRQLKHTIERACMLCPGTTISSEHIPAEITGASGNECSYHPSPPSDLQNSPEILVKQYTLTEHEQHTARQIIDALKQAGGNKAKAARHLKMDRSTLYRKMHELHIDMDLFSS